MFETFTEYVNKFDMKNIKVSSKYDHSIRVARLCKDFGEKNNFSEKDLNLITIIGLLHDIGRFPQVTNYNSYSDTNVDHGDLAIKILFKDKEIENYNIEENEYSIIEKAIANHNKYEIDKELTGKDLLFAKIIRDCDKLEITYRLLMEDIENINKFYDAEDEVSKEIKINFDNYKCTLNKDVKNDSDKLINLLSFIYDLHFSYSYEYLSSKDILAKIFEKIKNKEIFKYYFKRLEDYVEEKLNETSKVIEKKELEKKYDFTTKEEKWLKYWEENNIYEFKPDFRRVYSIDTPPPTVSGNIHIGHIFSYSQTEMIARYKRLKGFNVFYPFGFDDNGLPSERLVEKEKGIKASEVSREEFQALCYETTDKYEKEFKKLFSRLGVSTDWNLLYKTVSPSTIKISQLSFLDLIEKEHCYHKESPALWCNECLTSIAQAELETKTTKTTFNYLKFKTEEDEEFTIATTRPELLPAIVAVFINSKDEKNKHLIGKTAIIPIINVKVPIMEDDKVNPEKGTGIVMCCTFGDQTDIEWWKKYNLPLKNIFTEDGLIEESISNYGGLKIKAARKKIIEDLKENGYLEKEEELEHEVQVHERCGKEIEYTVIKQWFIDIMNHKKEFIEIGKEINWYPQHMKNRYDEWVENVLWDWCISRQRYFGVPFPVWYCKDCGKPIFANKEDLPVNPLVDMPNKKCICGCCEFIPEKDVMDTWATSSVTPLINMKYGEKENYEDILKPMSLRTNASEIIRTWDFYTIVKSYYHFGIKPWDNVMISGFVMADKGEKISKSKGNAKVEPIELIKEYSADVLRYWAGSGRVGTDIIFSEETLIRGKKLINKLYNMASFVNMHLADYKEKDFIDFEYFDKWILGKYQEMETQFNKYLDEYEVGLGLNTLEKFFWNFCDNYIEIVKHRLYRPEEFGEEARYSGQKTCFVLLYKLLQDFSIFFPYITEELYQNIYGEEKSIHMTEMKELGFDFSKESKLGDNVIEIISQVRGIKTNKNVSLKTIINTIDIEVNNQIKDVLDKSLKDFKATLTIKDINISVNNEISYNINNIELEK